MKKRNQKFLSWLFRFFVALFFNFKSVICFLIHQYYLIKAGIVPQKQHNQYYAVFVVIGQRALHFTSKKQHFTQKWQLYREFHVKYERFLQEDSRDGILGKAVSRV